MRRALFITSIVVVILGLAIAAYFLFFVGSAGVSVSSGTSTTFPAAGEQTTGSSTSAGVVSGNGGGSEPSGATKATPRLREIDKGPVVAGATAFDIVATSTGTTTKDVEVEYLSRESGNVFSYLWNADSTTRLSNRTIPGIQRAYWLSGGDTALVQYLSGADNSTINTYALPAMGAGGSFLPQNIAGLSAGAGQALYVASGASGSIGTLEKLPSRLSTQVFTTPLSQIRAQLAGKQGYLVYTKPSAGIAGYAFLVSGGAFAPLAGPLPGLVALASPAGSAVLVSYSVAGILKMELIDTKTRAVTALPLATIADKCVWASDSSAFYCGIPQSPPATSAYPDDWYQGAVHFSDKIWKFDVADHVATLVFDAGVDSGAAFDATDLSLDAAQKVLLLRNKNDASLWAYQL